MTDRYLPRVMAALGLVLLVTCLPANAATTLNDAEARAHLEEMERQGILADPIWARAYWTRARTAPTEQARAADLRWALRFDRDLSPARWDLTLALLKQRDSEFAGQGVQAVSRSLRAFPSQLRMVLWVITLGGGALVLTLTVAAFLAFLKAGPRIHHGLHERLLFLPAEGRIGASILTLALPFLVAVTLPPTAALFWALMFGTVGAWVVLDRWERRTCVSALVVILVAPLALSLWARVIDPALPGSYLRALWIAQRVEDSGVAATVRVAAPPAAAEDPDRLASMALVDRRAGRLDEAAEKLQQAVALAPQDWSYLNNLGNIHLLAGEVPEALEAYTKAIMLAPQQPLPRVNQAQAWVRMLEFRRADESLGEALRLGYRLPPVLSDDPSDVIVHDRVLDASALWLRFARGEGIGPGVEWRRALDMTLGTVLPLRPFFLSLPLFLALYWVGQTRTLPRVTRCAGCGRTICRKCHYRMLRRSFCGHCYTITREVRAPLKRVSMLDERRHRVTRVARPIILGLSILLPGAGHAMYGAHRRAGVYLTTSVIVLLWAWAGTAWPDVVATVADGPANYKLITAASVWILLAIMSARATLRLRMRPIVEPETQTPRSA